MRIRTVFTASLTAIAVVTLCVGSVAIHARWQALRHAEAALELGEAFAAMSLVPQRLASERAAVTRALAAAEPGAAERQTLSDARRDTDARFAAAAAAARGAGSLLSARVAEAFARGLQETQALRAEADALAARPHAERLATQPRLSARGIEIQGRLNEPLAEAEQQLDQQAPELGRPAGVARMAVDLREALSTLIIPLGGPVRQGRPATVEEIARAESGRGAFEAILQRLRAFATGEDAPVAVRRSFEQDIGRVLEAKRSFDRFLDEARAGRHERVDVALWDRQIDVLVAVFTLRDAALAELRAAAQAARERALSGLLLIGGVALVALAGLLAGGWLFRRHVLTALERITAAMGEVARGNLATEVPYAERRDEVGELAQALDVFKRNALTAQTLQREREAAEAARQRRVAAMEAQVQAFATTVNETLGRVATSTEAMTRAADSVGGSSEQTRHLAESVANAAERASGEVQTIAAATEELSASVVEISRQVRNASAEAGEAVTEAEAADANVQGLANAAQKIGDVVRLISDIAAQTNLLALNATIEAARAGDAGKGFAVVASEVKNLAAQTARATEEISGQIGEIQAATGAAVGAIQGIARRIAEMNAVTSAMAAAVEQQGASTREIAQTIQRTAQGTQSVSREIAAVNDAATSMGGVTGEMIGTIQQVMGDSDRLRRDIDGFLAEIRAA